MSITFTLQNRCLQCSLWLFLLFSLFSCVSTPRFDGHKVEFFSLLDQNHPLVRTSALLVGSSGSEFAFCNGVYLAPEVVLTAAHCLVDGLKYSVFLPIEIRPTDPTTAIVLAAKSARGFVRHPEYVYRANEGVVRNDIGLVFLDGVSKNNQARAPSLVDAKFQLKSPTTIRWNSSDESNYFSAEPSNQVSILGFMVEKNSLLKGVYQVRDAATYLGDVKLTHSILISLNPGTSLHQGVSGAGVYCEEKKTFFLCGIASHVFPGVNLFAATDIRYHRAWIDQETKKITTTVP